MISLETLRQFRVLDYAVFDLAISFLAAWILSPLLSFLFRKIKIEIPKRNWIIWTLPIAFIAHLIAGTNTLMTQRLLDPSGHYLLKIVIIFLTLLGFKGIKRMK